MTQTETLKASDLPKRNSEIRYSVLRYCELYIPQAFEDFSTIDHKNLSNEKFKEQVLKTAEHHCCYDDILELITSTR